tara:strand:- start:986 stop:1639 length:654 start_codon:yes stop_codon:yes gene_type:complete
MTEKLVKQLFGFPVYHSSIDKKKYDKNILKTILANFKKSKIRDNWNKNHNSFTNNKIHHSNGDELNKIFKQPNYDSLIPIYTKEINSYFSTMATKDFKYKFKIVNYTCMTKDYHMKSHVHTDCDFTAVHYLKFDKKTQDSTVFLNTNDYAKFIDILYPNTYNTFLKNHLTNSWILKYCKILTKEDDLIIFPAMMEHSVPAIKSDKIRVTIVFNINII